MAVLAQGLPVTFVPEEILVSPVRKDMVNNCGRRELAFSLALDAQGIPFQVSFSGRPPSGVITTVSSAFTCI
jgi:hypothetical protein